MNLLSYPYCTGMMSPFGRNLTASMVQVRIYALYGIFFSYRLKN